MQSSQYETISESRFIVTFVIGALIGWLEPLLDRIADDKRHVVYPQMPNIKDDTLEFKAFSARNIQVGRFDWQLIFRWMDLPEYINRTRKSFISPTWCVFLKIYDINLQIPVWHLLLGIEILYNRVTAPSKSYLPMNLLEKLYLIVMLLA